LLLGGDIGRREVAGSWERGGIVDAEVAAAASAALMACIVLHQIKMQAGRFRTVQDVQRTISCLSYTSASKEREERTRMKLQRSLSQNVFDLEKSVFFFFFFSTSTSTVGPRPSSSLFRPRAGHSRSLNSTTVFS
jgi:hypothetical protein